MLIEIKKAFEVGKYDGWINGVKFAGNFSSPEQAMERTLAHATEIKTAAEWVAEEVVLVREI